MKANSKKKNKGLSDAELIAKYGKEPVRIEKVVKKLLQSANAKTGQFKKK